MSLDRAGLLALTVLALACTAAPSESEHTPEEPSARAVVFYPRGGCATGELEIEVYDRAARAWRPHPTHPRLRADRCAEEQAGTLLNELRVRCVDPDGERQPSLWVTGAALSGPPIPCSEVAP
jgi:hypothetical protein